MEICLRWIYSKWLTGLQNILNTESHTLKYQDVHTIAILVFPDLVKKRGKETLNFKYIFNFFLFFSSLY